MKEAATPMVFITDINSTVGYSFGKHFAMDMGVPYLFFQPSISKKGATSASGVGNPYLGLTYSLRRILRSYLDYYHRSRTHLSLGKDSPEPRSIQPEHMGRVVALPQIGGLHHRYERRAA
jgi:hypothetical protein